MALISSAYGIDSEDQDLWSYLLGGIETAILGRGPRWSFTRNRLSQSRRQDPRVIPIDCSRGELLNVAMNVPHLNVVISRGAELFANAQLQHLDRSGEPVENSDVLRLLRKPNPMQRMSDFLFEFYLMNAVYSQNFIFKNSGSALSALPGFLWNLPSGEMEMDVTGKMYRQTDVRGIIKAYRLRGDDQPFTPEEIFMMRGGLSRDGLVSYSRIEGMQMPLSNIVAALKSNNIILTERGLIGFIAHEQGKDSDGGLPPDKDETRRIEKDYQKQRSLDAINGHVSFTTASVKWVPMTFDVGQLMIFEGLEDAFGNICAAWGIDRDVFPSTKGATNENKKTGIIGTYQNTMQPLLDRFCEGLTDELGLDVLGERLTGNYDWLPVMKADELKKSQALATQSSAIASLVSANIINPAQAQQILISETGIKVDVSLANTNATIEKLTELSPLVANNMLGNLTINEVRELIGLPAIAGGDALAKIAALASASPSTSNP